MKWIVLLAVYAFGLTRFAWDGRWNELLLSGGVLAVLAIFLAVSLPLKHSRTGKEHRRPH